MTIQTTTPIRTKDLNFLAQRPVTFKSLRTQAEMEFTSINSGHKYIEFIDCLERWQTGDKLIQDVMPSWLSLDEREFCITGFTPQMWEGLEDD